MKNKDKRLKTRIRNNRRYDAAPVPSSQFKYKKLSVVAASVALSLGLGYQAIAATESTPFSKESLGVTATTTTSTGSTGSTTTSTTTTAQSPTTAGLTPNGQTNLGSGSASTDASAIPFDPSAAVLANAQSCAEDMKVIREEALVRDIEMADAGFNVDTFFKDVRESGCLVSVQDSISLANQITSLSGGSIASMIMSQVESKILEASNQMLQKVFDKGCEVMLEASQGVYGPINDVVKKYGVYGNPDMVGNTVGGLIDGVADEAMFNFDSKLDELGNQILAKNSANGSGSSGSSGGSLLPPATGGMGSTTGTENITDAQIAAAQSTVEDLAESRNRLAYPYYEKQRRETVGVDRRGDNIYEYYRDVHMHTLNTRSPQGTLLNSIQNGNIQNDSNAACVYIAQITSINNEIIRIVNEKGVQNTTLTPVQPMNLAPAYWNAANSYIKSAPDDCAQEEVELTTPSIDYSTAAKSSTFAIPSQPSTVSVAPSTSTSSVSTAPTTNEATQYMQSRQATTTTTQPVEPAETSSNPFSKMKSIFN